MPAALLTLFLAGFGLLWPKQTIIEDATYDYIIVGGGTSGCIVARRLVEAKKNVLLLEAGGDPTIKSLLPALFYSLPGSKLDYDYQSTFDSYAASSQGNHTMLTAGKMLGGSAGLNHFIMIRGVPSDYDNWANITGDRSWEYDKVLPYFIRSETVEDDEIIKKYGKYHGTDGPMGLSKQNYDDTIGKYLEAFAEVGNPTVLDLNANKTTGYTQPLLMIAHGIRQTPSFTYLTPVKQFPNLHVSKDTTVCKIVFEGKTAVGVEVIYNNKKYTLKAKNEVIISGGVFNTPQILMLSGIGPKEHLESMNISVISDLPVGDNLIDQVSVTLVHKTKKYMCPIPNQKLLASAAVPTGLPFPVIAGSVPLDKNSEIPDYQAYGLILPHDTPFLTATCAQAFGYRPEICKRLQKQVARRDAFYTILANVQQKSRGTVRLKSTDPFDAPRIVTNFYKNKEDLDNMVKFIRDYTKVGDSKFFKSVDAELVGLDLPECSDKERDSDDFWKCYILNMSISAYHYVGTCPMGTVVDGNLKVKGMKNLRIVDASVMPDIPHSEPYLAVAMIAEKASDMIRADGNCNK